MRRRLKALLDSIWPRVALGGGLGALGALALGAAMSLLSDSAVEGVYAGVVVSGSLLTAAFVGLTPRANPGRRKRTLFRLHTVLGLIVALPLLLISVTGALLSMRPEIELAADPGRRVSEGEQLTSPDDWLGSVARRTPITGSRQIDIDWPVVSGAPVKVRIRTASGLETFFVDPSTARLVEGKPVEWLRPVRKLHTELLMGHIGHSLAGLAALAGSWLAFSGLLFGRDLFRDGSKLRWAKGGRIFVSDFHKRMATWLLPIFLLFCITGVLLGLFGPLAEMPVRLRFGGNVDAFWAAKGSTLWVNPSVAAPMRPLEEIIETARRSMPKGEISSIRLLEYGDHDAVATLRVSRPDELTPRGSSQVLELSLRTGETLLSRDTAQLGFFERSYLLLKAAHVGEFESAWLRGLYLLSGLAIAILPITGVLIWFWRSRFSRWR